MKIFARYLNLFKRALSFLSVMASFFNEMSEEIASHFVATITDNQILQDDLNAL